MNSNFVLQILCKCCCVVSQQKNINVSGRQVKCTRTKIYVPSHMSYITIYNEHHQGILTFDLSAGIDAHLESFTVQLHSNLGRKLQLLHQSFSSFLPVPKGCKEASFLNRTSTNGWKK